MVDEERRAQRRQQLLSCAAQVFAEQGYAPVTVDDIRRRAGVARGTFYLYFKDKADVFSALIDDFFLRLRAQIHRIDLAAAEPPLEQLRANLLRVTSLTAEEPALTHLVLEAAAGLDAGLDARLAIFWDSVIELVESSIVDGQGMGLVCDGEPQMLARMALGAVKELLLMRHSGANSHAADNWLAPGAAAPGAAPGSTPAAPQTLDVHAPAAIAEALMSFVATGMLRIPPTGS